MAGVTYHLSLVLLNVVDLVDVTGALKLRLLDGVLLEVVSGNKTCISRNMIGRLVSSKGHIVLVFGKLVGIEVENLAWRYSVVITCLSFVDCSDRRVSLSWHGPERSL